ncbi:hypothetical protein ACJJTC_018087 [Scirpophaga incertulas]
MLYFGSIILLVAVCCVSLYCNGLTLPDVSYSDIAKAITEDFDYGDYEDYDYEITEEDLTDLRFSLIYPGTKWCGAGDIADNYDDLGEEEETDKCCRAHDHCPDIIPSGETKYNLTNKAFYTRLSCKCDVIFKNCLHQAKSSASSHIGNIYFNVIGTKCFRKDYPVVGCKKRGGWLKKKCLIPNYDTTGDKKYQWFDVPNY